MIEALLNCSLEYMNRLLLHHDARRIWLSKQAFPWWVAWEEHFVFLMVPTYVMFQSSKEKAGGDGINYNFTRFKLNKYVTSK